MRLLLLLVAILLPAAVRADAGVQLDSQVFVERFEKDANGRTKAILQAPTIVTPGDRLVFILNYKNKGTKSAQNFIVTNPMPSAVAFQDVRDSRAILSVDGGRSWGRLTSLKVLDSDRKWRSARPEDVTHVRWPLGNAIPVGGAGQLSFRGIVR